MNLQETIRRVLIEMDVNKSKDWGDSKEKLERTFKFKDFNESIDFVNKVAKIAEKQNHHPDITINYNKVKISITDHEKGGVSEKCRRFVKSINELEKPNEEEQNESEVTEYSRTLKNARKQDAGLRFPKSAIKSNPLRFRPYNRK
jgi:4a-hydroxytetrahydrobiopterin dehydratase